MRRIRFTQEGLDRVKKEYADLQESRDPAVKELVRAREMGDLSENGLYHAAKSRLRSIDSTLRRLSTQIKLAEVYTTPVGKIGIGSKVSVNQDNKDIEYQIVGDFEANPMQNRISPNSPIGQALLGKKEGDNVEIFTPSGTKILKISKVQ